MKLTTETLLEYFNQVYKLKKDYPCLRLGQCHINIFVTMFPDIDDSYVGTDSDCFYNDEKIDKFIEWIYTQIEE